MIWFSYMALQWQVSPSMGLPRGAEKEKSWPEK